MSLKAPSQSWACTYAADRRKHRHRCTVCNRIVEPGQEVIMLRLERGTKAVHVEPCSAAEHSPGVDYAEAFRLWGVARNAALGYGDAKRVVDTHPFFTGRQVAA